ncbi:MAG TPA: anaerobic carbon-monoxide dehydrogenase catalytic subunit [Bacillota bacterium]|jgi:carbon-monoxide dehydrogenase catalytic subunit
MPEEAKTPGKAKVDVKTRTADPASFEMLTRAEALGVTTAWDRYQAQQPQCGFGMDGVCCRACIQGPCRINPRRENQKRGICGATDFTIVSRNLVRFIAGGTSSHSDHGRHIAHTLHLAAEGKAPDYKVTDGKKLRRVAERIGIAVEGKSDNDLAKEVSEAALEDFSRHSDEPCTFLTTTITEGRQKKFKHANIAPSAIDKQVVQALAQTTMGMDADPVNLIFGGLKTALADYTGMHIGTDLSDILFGTPKPVVSEANLGTINPDYVNIATHGHNPTLSSIIVDAARALEGEAKAAGAKGVNVVGICCTGNELLMRRGVYLATNTASQELAIMTGALDAMIVDIQCIMPSIRVLSECFHTKIITTNPLAKIPNTHYVDFKEEKALETAKEMVRLAIEGFKQRDPAKIAIPKLKNKVIAGFSTEALIELFAAVDPEHPVKVLTDAIEAGEIKGVCLFAGCNNMKQPQDEGHLTVAKELAKNDVFMLATGCGAGAFAKAGLLNEEAVEKYAGPGLKSFLKRLQEAAKLPTGLPLIFHQGSCVDNTRSADLCTLMAKELGVDVPKVPFVASAPEAMHEKAVSIGSWAVAMGLPTHVGVIPHIEGSQLVYGVATQIAHDVYGGYFIFETNSQAAASKLLDALKYRTWKLGVHREAAKRFNTPLAASW